MRLALFTALVLVSASANLARAADSPDWGMVHPIFTTHCIACHAGADAPLGLRLDSYENALKGSTNGPVVVAGDAKGSELIRRVRGDSQPRMPLTGPPYLNDEEIARLEAWVLAGMPQGAGGAKSESPEPSAPPRPKPGEAVTFPDVQPIFQKRCLKCHMDGGKMGAPPEGLKLDSYANIVAGAERVVVVPGNPDASELIRRIEGKAVPRMPFDGPPYLEEDDIRLLRQWIDQGARNADGAPAPSAAGRSIRFRGQMTGASEIDGLRFLVDGGTRIDKSPRPGDQIELRGVITPEGQVRAVRLRRR